MNKKTDNFIIFNHKFEEAEKPLFTKNNRGLKFGDALFETIRYHKGTTLYLNDHITRLHKGLSTLMMEPCFSLNHDELHDMITSLVLKNRIYKDARIRVTIFRNDGGLYTPQTNKTSFIIEASPLQTELYELNKKGLLTKIFTKHTKHASAFSGFKNAGAFVNILAGIYKNENNLDDCLIINSDGKVIEGISSNLFVIKDKSVLTPAVKSGCVSGIMRKQVLSVLKNMGIKTTETDGFTKEDLLNADELFLTNAIQGIQWIVGMEEKRYYNILTKQISRTLIEKTVKESEEIN
ncbi:MAG: aminotransferase IV [Chlorobi bacterium]|nr:aminotransferase IV [Chlorobiota bacterium]